jgi:adenosylmethionine-8-amino-7-oxononanoate aminotransferase
MDKLSLLQADRQYLVHPVSNFTEHQRQGAKILKSGQGAYLTDIDGNTLLDAFAGLWCVNVGYGQQSVVEAATRQMSQLPYATGYFGFASEPAIELAQKLIELTPASLQHVYFTLGGSDADDSAVRYITRYFNAIGKPNKKQFIALERGYHGSSSTGAGLTALPVFHHQFDLPLPTQHYIPSPYPYRSEHEGDDQAIIAASVAALRAKVEQLGADNVAAFFCEPVQGSGGVIVPPKGWLKAMEQACKELDILLVVDEVITGFGRTGPLFACLDEGVEPDLLVLAKGLTSGYAPMGALLMSEAVFQGIAADNSVVGHGYTYSGHPVSAAIGLEVLRLYTEGGLLAHAQAHEPLFREGLQALQKHPLVGDARSRGLLGAVELVANKTTKARFDPALKLNELIAERAYQNKLIFRAFADNILGFAPALCFGATEFEQLFERLEDTLDQVLEIREVRQAIA